MHLGVAFAIGASALLLRGGLDAPGALPIALSAAFVSVAWFPLFPMVAFKPDARTLRIDEHGLVTTIGRRSGKRSWSEVASIEEHEGAIVVTGTNLNAFIIPRRAFTADAERTQFLARAREWFKSARLGTNASG